MSSVIEDVAPPGWRLESLGNIATINPESLGASTALDYRFGYIDISSVERGKVFWNQVNQEIYRTAPSRARRIVQDGDVMHFRFNV